MTDASPSRAHALIDAFERDPALDQPLRMRERTLALEWLEEWLAEAHHDASLRDRARLLQARLAGVQARLCDSIRHDIRRGRGAQALHPWRPASIDDAEGYDPLDALLGDVFAFDEPAGAIAPLEPGMVFYQPTPMRHVFDLVERAGIGANDAFVDLGSGLGHVPMLVAMLTGARCIGIEREPVYVHAAQKSAVALQLNRVSFVAQDVRAADLSSGSVFYLYTPFTGGMLRTVLDGLHHEAQRRAIRLVTFGPCTASVAAEPWLRPAGDVRASRITVFRSTTD